VARISIAIYSCWRYICNIPTNHEGYRVVEAKNAEVPNRSMARSPRSETIGIYGALLIFALVAFYLIYANAAHNILLGVGATFILYSTTGGDLTGSILAGGLLALAVYYFYRPSKGAEGFQDSGEDEEEPKEEKPKAKKAKVPPPDHADRPAEMFELGKKYKMPAAEGDDKEFHLDAGTTFMNAYKSLKPEQIAAMTKDTQELMETQKQLMGTLQTLKPLIQDGKQMMEMFQSYFGAGNPTLN
jgi:hypothetical protein